MQHIQEEKEEELKIQHDAEGGRRAGQPGQPGENGLSSPA
jgi:hypothetical protein